MQTDDQADIRKFFLTLSILYWLGVALVSFISPPAYQLMKQFIQMHAEYSLLEQTSKLLLLVMLFVSLFAYSNRKKGVKVRLASLFILFSLVLYFSESNFVASEWQPVFGAFFITLISWQLLKSDIAALAFMVLGAGFIFLGVISDVLLDKPHLMPVTPFFEAWKARAGLIEEQFDLWGIACMTFSALVAFRVKLSRMFAQHPGDLLLLLLALGLIASGNSFVHWQYNPSKYFEVISTVMTIIGIAGVFLVDRRILARGFRLTHFDREGLYIGFLILFGVLPVVYGGSGNPFNLILWLGFLYYLYKLLIRSHPTVTDR